MMGERVTYFVLGVFSVLVAMIGFYTSYKVNYVLGGLIIGLGCSVAGMTFVRASIDDQSDEDDWNG